MKKLTAKECEEIYYALISKRGDLLRGRYDMPFDACMPAECRRWARKLAVIIKKIGPDGRLLFKDEQK